MEGEEACELEVGPEVGSGFYREEVFNVEDGGECGEGNWDEEEEAGEGDGGEAGCCYHGGFWCRCIEGVLEFWHVVLGGRRAGVCRGRKCVQISMRKEADDVVAVCRDLGEEPHRKTTI